MTPTSSIPAYPAESFDLGCTRDGHAMTLAPMSCEAADQIGTEAATFGPWLAYGVSASAMARSFQPAADNGARYHVRVAGELAGGMIIRDPWLVGPYLQTIAVLPAFQSSGIGGVMLDWFEARARLARQRNIWLCVSAFNTEAQKFYRAHGWEHAADLPDLIREGVGEQLMRKRLPLHTL
jgi:diamine N-acetyltransferase